jgi:hypothetical protein
MKLTSRIVALCAVALLVTTLSQERLAAGASRGSRQSEAATGGGWYFLQNAFEVQIAFAAVAHQDGGASGQFHHRTTDETGTIDFHGEVTCLSVDSAEHRAWIGGVITENNSTSPTFNQAIHQPGHDIWFRVLDNGQGLGADPDRTTFVGFEGVIPDSATYCATRPWPADNARTWPLTQGNIQVRP